MTAKVIREKHKQLPWILKKVMVLSWKLKLLFI